MHQVFKGHIRTVREDCGKVALWLGERKLHFLHARGFIWGEKGLATKDPSSLECVHLLWSKEQQVCARSGYPDLGTKPVKFVNCRALRSMPR